MSPLGFEERVGSLIRTWHWWGTKALTCHASTHSMTDSAMPARLPNVHTQKLDA